MSFLILISIILLFIGLAILWSECDEGEGGPCYIKWGILWLLRKKGLLVLLILVIGGGIAGYFVYYMPLGYKAQPARLPRGDVSQPRFFINRVGDHGKVTSTKLPSAYINDDGELEIVIGSGTAAQSEVLGPVVIYYTENSVPVRAKVLLRSEKDIPEIEYNGQLGIISIIFKPNARIAKAVSSGKGVAYFDKNGNIVRVEIPNVHIPGE